MARELAGHKLISFFTLDYLRKDNHSSGYSLIIIFTIFVGVSEAYSYIRESVFVPLMEKWKISINRRSTDILTRSCYDYASIPLTRMPNPYQAECGVLSVVCPVKGFHSFHQANESSVPHFCVIG